MESVPQGSLPPEDLQMKTLRRSLFVLSLTFATAACGTSITDSYNPDPGGYNPDPGGYNPDPGGYNPDPGGYNPDPGGYNPDPGGHNPDPGA
jgi:hypothetical protein